MMLFRRFVETFGRARPADVALLEQTRICFTVADVQCPVRNIEFDVANNIWSVNLSAPQIPDEAIQQAVDALREPNRAFDRVPNAVRQSLADMIELLSLNKGAGHA